MDQATQHLLHISATLNIPVKGIMATVELLDEGATIPFIARYRKELTGTLDEVQIANIRDEITRLRELDKRRDFIRKTIDDQGKLSAELEKKINEATTLTELEDIYLPYKPKRKTKASVAREKGLEPLALQLLEQNNFVAESVAIEFVNEEKEVNTVAEALQGARDIIAEIVNEDPQARQEVRHLFTQKAIIKSKVLTGKEKEGEKYKDYFEWEESLSKAPSHRILAMRRGEKEMILTLDVSPPSEEAIYALEKNFIKANNDAAKHVKIAIEDAYKRLLKPSIETEFRLSSKKFADEKAIEVFSQNLRELLLSSPLGQKSILAIDPGFRTGCKIACLDRQGKLLENHTIYPTEPQKKIAESGAIILALCQKHAIEAIAIGNGTASRETEAFVKGIKELPKSIQVIVVNESGASVYSASDVAREEFPNEDLTVRGTVSIGRRLSDPLAELVKIDPKSIGVGQYQHDVDQTALKKALDDVVSSCVNLVGVELNTASKQLLTYVSGLGPQLAENIVKHRNEVGAFKSRAQLLEVPRMGAKAFEQCAGFLRVRDGENPLDASAVHPESYEIVQKMASDGGCTIEQLIKDAERRKRIDLKAYVTEKVGLPTLTDILNELAKPGRDPRESFEAFSFQEGVNAISDLRQGMRLPGIVTNVTNFGAFVDIGVHQDGLVHLSQLTNRFIQDPNEVVKVGQKVTVTVTEVDVQRKRIGLSMRDESEAKPLGGGRKQKTVTKEKEVEGDMQAKLAALKSLWKK